MCQGKFVFEPCPGSVNGRENFPDFKVVSKHACFLDELLARHDNMF